MNPTISLAMIVRDGGEGFRDCLASVQPHVDEIVIALDTRTKDDSRQIAEGFGAKVYDYEWKRPDFAAARNFSFSHVTGDWLLWLDGDDVVENGERLREMVRDAAPGVGGFWVPYLYGFDDQGNCNTILDRERLLRRSIGFTWQGRLHEVVVPPFPVKWEREQEFMVIHKSKGGTRTDRNLPILLDWIKDEPDNIRVKMFIGNQYFAEAMWPQAVRWYTEFYRDPRAIWYDRYESATYAARALREMGRPLDAWRADDLARSLYPEWADAWIGLAEDELHLHHADRALHYARIADASKPADRLVVANPLDYTVRLHMVWAGALTDVGKLPEALSHVEEALRVRPNDERGQETRDVLRGLIERERRVRAFQALSADEPDANVLAMASGLDDALVGERGVRDVLVPILLKHRPASNPRAVIFCGNSLEEWAAPTPALKGIGGSETAVVEIARRMAASGWNVEVYNRCGKLEGPHDGVMYLDAGRFNPMDSPDLFVAWRHPDMGGVCADARAKWLWQHDLNYPQAKAGDLAKFNLLCGVSGWHADYIKLVYPELVDRISYLPNGIDITRFQPETLPKKAPFRCVYSSSPDRGLDTLLSYWPHIKAEEPAAELHIFYGWENIDIAIRGGHRDLAALKERVVATIGKSKGVFWRGRLPQKELALEFLQAEAWLYPTAFAEVHCITAVEAMAAGAVPIASRVAALPWTVGDAGVLVEGEPRGTGFGINFIGAAVGTLRDTLVRRDLMAKGRERAATMTWDKVWEEHWQPKLQAVVGDVGILGEKCTS